MSYGRTKPSMESQSAEKLTEEINKYKELQETMKGVNAYLRKTGTCSRLQNKMRLWQNMKMG